MPQKNASIAWHLEKKVKRLQKETDNQLHQMLLRANAMSETVVGFKYTEVISNMDLASFGVLAGLMVRLEPAQGSMGGEKLEISSPGKSLEGH